MRKLSLLATALALCGCLGGCASQSSRREDPKVYQMGEPVKTGGLVYTVLDTEWFDQLGDPAAPRLPHNHFLAVRISVTNAGSASADVPPLTIVNHQGVVYSEIADARELPQWLGYLRTVKPAEAVHGRLLFDVPPADYGLKVTDDSALEDRSSATVQMPLELTHP